MEGPPEIQPPPEANTNVESPPESPAEAPVVQEAPPPVAVEAPPAQISEAELATEDDSRYDAPIELTDSGAASISEPEDDSLYDAPMSSEQSVAPETPAAVGEPVEMAKLEGNVSAIQAIEEVNKPLGEQMQDTQAKVEREIPLSPEAQETLMEGNAASEGLVETVPSDVVAPVRVDSQENTDADLTNNESRIEGAQAIAARNTAANIESFSQLKGTAEKDENEAELRDARGDYKFATTKTDDIVYKTAEGKLSNPDEVEKFRDQGAQRSVSGGTGDHAGHLIGARFGASGDVENLAQQNWRTNIGTYKKMEDQWAADLRQGSEVGVKITEATDATRADNDRFFTRKVEWETTPAAGSESEKNTLYFVNPHTPESRAAQNIEPTVKTPQHDNVIAVDFRNKKIDE